MYCCIDTIEDENIEILRDLQKERMKKLISNNKTSEKNSEKSKRSGKTKETRLK